MKNSIITILAILLLGSLILNFAIIKRNEIPDEMVAQNGTITVVEDEGEGKFRYEIDTDDGNYWTAFGDGNERVGDRLVVVFYTFKSADRTTWEILDYWKISS